MIAIIKSIISAFAKEIYKELPSLGALRGKRMSSRYVGNQ